MSRSRPYAYRGRGSSSRGRPLNTYERAGPDPSGRDLYEGLNKESTEVISRPVLDYRTSGQDVQPKNLTYIGSYNWIESVAPTILVPGEF